MKDLNELKQLNKEEQVEVGVLYTLKEIQQQPKAWKDSIATIIEKKDIIEKFLTKSGVFNQNEDLNIYITGAGSSEFVGNSAAPILQKSWNRKVISVPTTDFVTHPDYYILNNKKNLIISIARSGNSPESVATYNKTKELDPEAMQINICCNKDGEIVKLGSKDDKTLNILLPPETDDKSLVMTSSYTSMLLTLVSLTFIEKLDKYEKLVNIAALGAEQVISKANLIQKFISIDTTRILYLGTAELKGCAQESRLKSQEMTDGKILSDFNSYLGLRHGPQVFADKTSLIIAYISSDPTRRNYEIDLLTEMQSKNQGKDYLFVCDKVSNNMQDLKGNIIEVFPNRESLDDAVIGLPFVVVGQLCGMFKCIQIGHKPDFPSSSGTINRVVAGVKIY